MHHQQYKIHAGGSTARLLLLLCLLFWDSVTARGRSIDINIGDISENGMSVLAGFCIIFGLVLCPVGYKKFTFSANTIGFFVGGMFFPWIVQYKNYHDTWYTGEWLTFFGCGIFFLMLMLVNRSMRIICVGMWGGATLGDMIDGIIRMSTTVSTLWGMWIPWVVILALASAALTWAFQKPALILCISLLGMSLISSGVVIFLNQYDTSYWLYFHYWTYTVIRLVVFVASAAFQYFVTGKGELYHLIEEKPEEEEGSSSDSDNDNNNNNANQYAAVQSPNPTKDTKIDINELLRPSSQEQQASVNLVQLPPVTREFVMADGSKTVMVYLPVGTAGLPLNTSQKQLELFEVEFSDGTKRQVPYIAVHSEIQRPSAA